MLLGLLVSRRWAHVANDDTVKRLSHIGWIGMQAAVSAGPHPTGNGRP